MRIAVGRSAVGTLTLRLIAGQSLPPDRILVRHMAPKDISNLPRDMPGLHLLPLPPATSRQHMLRGRLRLDRILDL